MSDQLERTLTRKGQATRDRIVDAAARLIAVHGVAGTGMDDVRAAAEVSGSQIYHYFDSKQALVRAVITRRADAAVEQGGLPALGPLDSFDALLASKNLRSLLPAQQQGVDVLLEHPLREWI